LKGSHREQDNPLEIQRDTSLFQRPSINKKKDDETDLTRIAKHSKDLFQHGLVGGFNPSEKY
jgi:hypothetical protein